MRLRLMITFVFMMTYSAVCGAQHRDCEGGGVWTMGADSSDIKYDCFQGRSPVDVHGNSCTAAVKFTGDPKAGTME